MMDDKLINKDLQNELIGVIRKYAKDGESMAEVICILTDTLSEVTDEGFSEFSFCESDEQNEGS